MHETFDAARIDEVLAEIVDTIPGDWVLVGGALAALWLDDRRVTEDIDIVGMSGTGEQRMALLDLTERLGLPVEAVTSAADWFLRRIPGWQDDLVLFREGRLGRIFRPTETLFVLSKLSRLSEQDLADCLAAIELARATPQPVDAARVRSRIASLPQADEVTAERRTALLASIDD